MNCKSLLFFKQSLWYNQIVFATIKIICNRTNKSVRKFGGCIFVNNTFNLNVKIRGNFFSTLQFTYYCIAFVSHWYFWCPMYRELQCIKKCISFILFSSDICIIRITLAEKRVWRCYYMLFHLANINIGKNSKYRSFNWAAMNLFN